MDRSRISTPNRRRERMTWSHRPLFALVAVIANGLFVLALTATSHGQAGLLGAPSLEVRLLRADSIQVKPNTRINSRVVKPLPLPDPAPPPTFDFEIPTHFGPPTETKSSLARMQAAIPDAIVLNEAGLEASCGRRGSRHSGDGEEETIAIRMLISEEGRVLQGQLERSSGDLQRDEALVKCVALEGEFQPGGSSNQSILSWQRLRWRF